MAKHGKKFTAAAAQVPPLLDTTRCRPRVRTGTGADVVSNTVISPASPAAFVAGSGAVKYATPPYMLDAK